MTPSYTMTINGDGERGETFFDVEDPARGAVVAQAPDCTPEQLDQAFAAAQRAFPGWAGLDPKRRRDHLLAAADRVADAGQELTDLVTTELGKPVGESRADVARLRDYLRYYADMRLEDQVLADGPGGHVRLVRQPIGVVAAMIAWNAPMSMFGLKAAPALAAGNTVVIKPSPVTPLSALRLGELLRGVLPPGVLNVVTGVEPLGAAMVAHPAARKVTFTGSIPVGKKIAAAAAPDLKRVTLELGGNDPAVVLADADLNATAAALVRAAFGNCGQVCIAPKRLYAVGGIYDDLVEALADRARTMIVGDPRDPRTTVGPLATAAQREHVAELIADAASRGARVVAGGGRIPGPGYFHEVTVVAGISDGTRLVDEEQFGPAVPVVRCDSVADAVARANATNFGLGASVWTTDLDRARQIAGRLEAGTVWINTHRAMAGPQQPLGGWKWSGIGVERGEWSMQEMTRLKAVHEPRAVPGE